MLITCDIYLFIRIDAACDRIDPELVGVSSFQANFVTCCSGRDVFQRNCERFGFQAVRYNIIGIRINIFYFLLSQSFTSVFLWWLCRKEQDKYHVQLSGA